MVPKEEITSTMEGLFIINAIQVSDWLVAAKGLVTLMLCGAVMIQYVLVCTVMFFSTHEGIRGRSKYCS